MAQFTAQGRVKLLLFNGDGVSFGLEPKDPFHLKVRSIQPHKRKLKLSGSTTRIYSSSSSNKPTNFSKEGHLYVGDESVYRENEVVDHDFDGDDDDDDEFVRDDLACFRGLVLDISYRSILFLKVLSFCNYCFFYLFIFFSNISKTVLQIIHLLMSCIHGLWKYWSF